MGEIVPIRIAEIKPGRAETLELGSRDRLGAVRERRAAWGRVIRQLRVSRGFTTRSLADTIGLPSPTLISAVEAGRGRLPDGVLGEWAQALGMSPSEFAAGYLAAFEPDAYSALRRDSNEGGPA